MALIDVVEVREIVIPFHVPFRSGVGELSKRRLMLVCLHCGGARGWGECGPIPGYGAETYADARRALDDAATWMVGLELSETIRQPLLDRVASPSARFAIESALLDLAGHVSGLQTWKRLGGETFRIPVGAVIPCGPADDVIAAAADAADAGYHRIKLKVASPTDLDLVRAVAEAVPQRGLAIDANGAFSGAELPALEEIDDLGLRFIEQPFPADDIKTSAALASRIATPICLDESISSPAAARRYLEAGACSMIVVKPARLGGFGPSRQVLELAAAAGAGVWVGGMLESGIGRAAALAAATLPGTTAPADLAPPRRLMASDLLLSPWALHEGVIEIPKRPGLGFEVDRDAVERFSIEVRRHGEPF
jgi:O-succinylbenzoate synthase